MKHTHFLSFVLLNPHTPSEKKYSAKSYCFDVVKCDTIWLDTFFQEGCEDLEQQNKQLSWFCYPKSPHPFRKKKVSNQILLF